MDSENTNKASCAEGLTRKEFIRKIVEKGTAAGVLAVSANAYSVFRAAPGLAVKAASGPTGP